MTTITFATESFKSNKGTIDWSWVERATATSEPPRVEDIPMHISFLKKYGGSPSTMHLVHRTLQFLDLAMPSGRIVSGNFFGAISSLKLPPHELMPNTMHAVLMLHAVGEKCYENDARTIALPMVKSLATTLKAKALKVDTMITRMVEVANSFRANGATLDNHEYTLLLGNASVELCKFVFDIDSRFRSMDDVVSDFVYRITGAPPTTEASVEQLANADSSTLSHIDGASNAGKVTLINAGFKVGSLLMLKASPHNRDVQFELIYINDDGSVGMSAVRSDGETDKSEVMTETLDNIVDKYRVMSHLKRIELLEGYPRNKASDSKIMHEQYLEAIVILGLRKLSEAKGFDAVDFRIQVKPTVRLISLVAIEAGRLRIIPFTPRIVHADRHKGDAPKGIHEKVTIVDVKSDKVFGTVYLSKYLDKDYASEFWYADSRESRKDCNCKLEDTSVLVMNNAYRIDLCCLVNTRAIAKDEQILYFKEKPKKVETGAKVVMMPSLDQPPQKKHKKQK